LIGSIRRCDRAILGPLEEIDDSWFYQQKVCSKIHETFLEPIQHHSGGTVECLPIDGVCLQFVDRNFSYREKVNGPNTQVTGWKDKRDRDHNGTERPDDGENRKFKRTGPAPWIKCDQTASEIKRKSKDSIKEELS
jgi:hypothetical protein